MAHRAKWVIHRATHQEDEIQIQEIQFLLGTGFYNYVTMTSSNKIKGTISAEWISGPDQIHGLGQIRLWTEIRTNFRVGRFDSYPWILNCPYNNVMMTSSDDIICFIKSEKVIDRPHYWVSAIPHESTNRPEWASRTMNMIQAVVVLVFMIVHSTLDR